LNFSRYKYRVFLETEKFERNFKSYLAAFFFLPEQQGIVIAKSEATAI
jgi:hypothetical protein